jgi:hypothetical protein
MLADLQVETPKRKDHFLDNGAFYMCFLYLKNSGGYNSNQLSLMSNVVGVSSVLNNINPEHSHLQVFSD